jgi:23S rRNA (adenine2503-C2)-methyltransferase
MNTATATSSEAPHFFEQTLTELAAVLKGLGKESFRAQQLFRWIYGRRVSDFSAMTNLSKSFREELPALLNLELPQLVRSHQSVDGTRKLLFASQGHTFESVLIPSEDRLTLCVSSEIGCNMACSFCYTGKQKLKRRLAAWEIVGQLVQANTLLNENERITNIVFMGMGEPLDNPDGVFKAIEIFHSPWGLNLSLKRITVSTSGLVPLMPLITQAGVRLAVSLNGVDDDVRSRLMPINRKWPIAELLQACREHAHATNDKVTFEYVLLKGETDSIEDARKLAQLTRSVPCKVNIIPFNEHPNSGFLRPADAQVQIFQNELMRLGCHVLRRKTMGRDIYAACGQLNPTHEEHPQIM